MITSGFRVLLGALGTVALCAIVLLALPPAFLASRFASRLERRPRWRL